MNTALLFFFFYPPTVLYRGVYLAAERLNGLPARNVVGRPARTDFTRPEEAIAAGATAIYEAQFLDEAGNAIPASAFNSLTLSIADAHGTSLSRANVLNTGRGQIDVGGNLTIELGGQDTQAAGTSEWPRSIILEYAYGDTGFGRHQVNLLIAPLLV